MKRPITTGMTPLALTAIMFVVLLSGCGGNGRLSSLTDESARSEEPISQTGYNHFVNANLLEKFGAYDEALREYDSALSYFPESQTIRTDYARLLFRMSLTEQALEQALLIEPQNADINLLAGDCYRLLGDIDAAAAYYRKAIELDPQNVNALWYLAGYYRQINQIDAVIATYYQLAPLMDNARIWLELGALLAGQGRVDDARKAFETAIDLDPDNENSHRIWEELGRLMIQSGSYAEAIDAFRQSISLMPGKENLDAYIDLAETYDAIDSLVQAEQFFEQAIQIDSNNVETYRRMEAMYWRRNDVAKAIVVSEKLVSLVPSDWMAQRRLGFLLYVDKQLEKADSLFQSRIEFGDQHEHNYFYRGRIALEQQRYDEAKNFLNLTIEKNPKFADGWLSLGFVYAEQDSLPIAIDLYREGLTNAAEHEDSVRLIFALGAALERNDQFHEAVTVFKDLIQADQNHAAALNYLGYMLADRGEQLTYALELIERALKISPDNGAFIDSYAWVQYKMGNYNIAITELKKAVDLLDDDAVIYEHLGDVYRAMGNIDEARSYYERALEIDPNSISIEEKLKE